MSRARSAGWQTLGRVGLTAGTALARIAVLLGGSKAARMKSGYTSLDRLSKRLNTLGGDPSRCSPEFFALLGNQMEVLSTRPGRMDSSVLAFASVLRAILIDQRSTIAAIERVTASALVLWGDHDPLVERSAIDRLTALRPDWRFEEFANVGHMLPAEVPLNYVRSVDAWLADSV